jgi:hypothetical protein
MDHSSYSEANSSSAIKEIPHYFGTNGPLPVSPDPMLSHISPAYAIPFYVFKIHFSITFLSTPRSYKRSVSLPGFLTKTLYAPLPSLIRVVCCAHLIFLDLITGEIGSDYWLF